MTVHPKHHISTAMAMLGLVAFFMATIMNFNQQIKVKMVSVITHYPSKSV
jgi:hypothetical protein